MAGKTFVTSLLSASACASVLYLDGAGVDGLKLNSFRPEQTKATSFVPVSSALGNAMQWQRSPLSPELKEHASLDRAESTLLEQAAFDVGDEVIISIKVPRRSYTASTLTSDVKAKGTVSIRKYDFIETGANDFTYPDNVSESSNRYWYIIMFEHLIDGRRRLDFMAIPGQEAKNFLSKV